MVEARWLLQQRDVFCRVAVNDQNVGIASDLELAHFMAEALEDLRRGVGAGIDGLERAESEIFNKNLHFTRVPLSVGYRRPAALRALDQRHPGAIGARQVLHRSVDLPLEGVGDGGAGIGRAGLEYVHQQGQGWHDDALVLQAPVNALVINERGVENDVKTGLGREQDRVAGTRVHRAYLAQAVRLVGDGLEFLEREGGTVKGVGGDQRIIGTRDLDCIDVVLGLVADLLDDFVAAFYQHAGLTRGELHLVGERVLEPLVRGELLA